MSLSNFGIETLGYFNAADNEKNAYHIAGDKDDKDTSGQADKLKADLGECETGEELVDVSSKEYVPLIEWLNLPIDCTKYNKTTCKELLKLIRNHFDTLEYIKNNPDKVVSFKEHHDRVSKKPKVRNKILCRIMKNKNNNKGEK